MAERKLRPWLPSEEPPKEPEKPAEEATPPPPTGGKVRPHLGAPPNITFLPPQWLAREVLIADLATLAKWAIACAIAAIGGDFLWRLSALSLMASGLFDAESVREVFIAFFITIGVFLVAAKILAVILVLIWYYQSAKNQRFVPEGGYPYSPGRTLGLMFIPLFCVWWVWRVLTQQAEALMRIKTAKGLPPMGLLSVRPLMAGYVTVVILGVAAAVAGGIIGHAIETSEVELTTTIVVSAVLLLLNSLLGFAAVYCEFRCIWDITVAMRDIGEMG